MSFSIQSRSDTSGATSLAFNSNVSQGDLLLVLVADNGNVSTFTCGDTQGNTYAPLTEQTNGASSASGQVFWAVAKSTDTITPNSVSVSSSHAVSTLAIHGVTGFNALDAADPSGAGTGNSQTSNSVSTNFADEFVFGWEYGNLTLGQSSVTKGSTYTLAESSANRFLTQYKVVSSTGAYTADSTTTTGKGASVSWVEGIATFYASVSATFNVTGFSNTAQLGTVTESGTATFSVIGIAATAQQGTAFPEVRVIVAGFPSTVAMGTFTEDGTAVFNVTGISAPASLGTVAAQVTVNVAGFNATAQQGTALVEVKIPITGFNSAASMGTAIATVAVIVTGHSASAQLGACTFSGTALVNVSGFVSTAVLGNAQAICFSPQPIIATIG